jgi:hypothetical protein
MSQCSIPEYMNLQMQNSFLCSQVIHLFVTDILIGGYQLPTMMGDNARECKNLGWHIAMIDYVTGHLFCISSMHPLQACKT